MKSQNLANKKIPCFWNWFERHEFELRQVDVQESLIKQLEENLFAIHELDWEIGPKGESRFYFALSPTGDYGLLELTRLMTQSAPSLRDWVFYPAKPPKDWHLIFSLQVDNRTIEIDAQQWEFILNKRNDNNYVLILKPDQDYGLSEDYLNWAAIIIADGELGEERRMTLLPHVQVVEMWEDDKALTARKLQLGILGGLLTNGNQ